MAKELDYSQIKAFIVYGNNIGEHIPMNEKMESVLFHKSPSYVRALLQKEIKEHKEFLGTKPPTNKQANITWNSAKESLELYTEAIEVFKHKCPVEDFPEVWL